MEEKQPTPDCVSLLFVNISSVVLKIMMYTVPYSNMRKSEKKRRKDQINE